VPSTIANGIRIEYDTFGSRDAEPLLLIMGLGAQMIAWAEEFCEMLAGRGHYVVRFDNRDVGLSEKIESAGVPDVGRLMAARQQGKEVSFAYTLHDMADDAAGLLDALDIEAAHVAGASLGGMIAQVMAYRHPARVRTLTSIMSTTGAPDLPPAKPEAQQALFTPAPAEREAFIEHAVKTARAIGSAPHLIDEARVREMAARRFDRSYYPVGVARQMAAAMVSGSRREALAGVTVPALVIHGAIDPLVPLEGGIDTAKAIPGAKLLVIEEMGHDLPKPLWPQIVDAISAHTGVR
jgi:pimeloyl-ACP methyl ester carboxylesterase